MRRAVAVLVFTLVASCAVAQEPRWTVSVLPGYQFNTQSYEHDLRYGRSLQGRTEEGFTGSVDATFRLSKRYGLHMSYFVTDQKFAETSYYEGHPYYANSYRAPVSIWEIGPEWLVLASERSLFIFQVNVGRTFSSGSASYRDRYNYDCWLESIRDNRWVFGGAAGFRFYFSQSAGLAAQVAYHRINGWDTPEIWDLRAGLTFRF
jgi:hypothetical protein